jgi:hypothetical protein
MALDAERELTQWTAGIDVNRTLWIAAVDVAFGRKVSLQGLPREGLESAPKPSSRCESK